MTMARGGWLNDNAHRAYPFLDAPLGMPLPESAVADFGCLVGPDARYDDAADAVYLYRVARAGGVFSFEFRSSAAGLADSPLTFHVPADAAEFARFEAEADAGAGSLGSSVGSDCRADPPWEGYLVVGDLADLRDALADGEDMAEALEGGGAATVEPGRVQNLDRTFVRAVHLANTDRTRVDPADGCGEASLGSEAGPPEVFVAARCLTGRLAFREGYNCVVRQSAADNSVTVGAAVGGGAGQPCGEPPLYPGEGPLPGETLLSGGPRCGEVVTAVNGVGGRTLRVTAGPGVSISPGLDDGVMVVSVDLKGLAVCRASSVAV